MTSLWRMLSATGQHQRLTVIPAARARRVLALLLCSTSAAGAQHVHGDTTTSLRPTAAWGAYAIGVVTSVRPGIGGRDLMEGYLTQPTLMAHAALPSGWLRVDGMFSLEGLTLERGELGTGMFGEGYVDRRHPHTYLHELVATADGTYAGVRASLSAGKGFAPFGTDDPMSRPFVKYPTNHHYAQILERALVAMALRRSGFGFEAGIFNGDEPIAPSDGPELSRLGDSWAARVSAFPFEGAELQVSHARVESPELETGGGLDQRKWSASARFDRLRGGTRRYALVEWARTEDLEHGVRAFRFGSALAEAAHSAAAWTAGVRLERTTRPEEERSANPFRSQRPHHDFNILGITRFTIATATVGRPVVLRRRSVLHSFIEVARVSAEQVVDASAFVPRDFYGSHRIWNLTAGVRVQAGRVHTGMGRYGAALPQSHSMNGH